LYLWIELINLQQSARLDLLTKWLVAAEARASSSDPESDTAGIEGGSCANTLVGSPIHPHLH